MFKKISHRWRSSFRFKLILATILLITLTVTIYSGLLFWHNAHVSEVNQKERATRLASLLAESLALPMFEFNILAVEAGVKALESHEEVRRVRVSDSNGKVIVDSSNLAQNGEILLTIQQKILHKTAQRTVDVGTIELAFSRNGLDAELYNSLFETVIAGVLMAAATVCAALWAFSSLDPSAGGDHRWPRSTGRWPDLHHLAATRTCRRIRPYDNGNASFPGRNRRAPSGRGRNS